MPQLKRLNECAIKRTARECYNQKDCKECRFKKGLPGIATINRIVSENHNQKDCINVIFKKGLPGIATIKSCQNVYAYLSISIGAYLYCITPLRGLCAGARLCGVCRKKEEK